MKNLAPFYLGLFLAAVAIAAMIAFNGNTVERQQPATVQALAAMGIE